MFRRVVLHLAAIQGQNQLYVEPLIFGLSPQARSKRKALRLWRKIHLVFHNKQDNTYTLRKRVPGPILITNYNPDTLSPDERMRLSDKIGGWSTHDVAFDIRPDHPGGEWLMRGAFRLRSFHSILSFLGHSLNDEPEYHVEKDTRIPPIKSDKNPIATMGFVVSNSPPSEAEGNLSIR